MLWVGTALAGYGDVVDGRPTWAQRELHTWTNLVRAEPAAFKSEYTCGFSSFKSSEKTAKQPLYYHDGLTEIAQLHTEEMKKTGELQHESADGTPFDERVWPYYSDGTTIGENVAMGYSDPRDAVIGGWMCSEGHRSNIMEAEFEDMGAGVKGSWFTQDFGGGAGTPHQPIAMGTHRPETPTGTVEFLFTFADSKAARQLRVDSDLGCLEPTLEQGTETLGGWRAEAKTAGSCVRYRFLYETASGDEGALPENGSYQYGKGCAIWVKTVADACAEPVDSPVDTGGDDSAGGDSGSAGDDTAGDSGDGRGRATPPPGAPEADCGGCSSPGSAGLLAGLTALALARRNGRRSSRALRA